MAVCCYKFSSLFNGYFSVQLESCFSYAGKEWLDRNIQICTLQCSFKQYLIGIKHFSNDYLYPN